MSESLSSYADKFWLILNAITAFAAAQGVATAITDWSRLQNNRILIIVGVTIALIMAVLYSVAIWRLTKTYDLIAKPEQRVSGALRWIFIGRLVIVWLFGLFAAASFVPDCWW